MAAVAAVNVFVVGPLQALRNIYCMVLTAHSAMNDSYKMTTTTSIKSYPRICDGT